MKTVETEGLRKHRKQVEIQEEATRREKEQRDDTLQRLHDDTRLQELKDQTEYLRAALEDLKQEVLTCESFIQVQAYNTFTGVMNRQQAATALKELKSQEREAREDITEAHQLVSKREIWVLSLQGRRTGDARKKQTP